MSVDNDTPREYDGFEFMWMFDDTPIFNPLLTAERAIDSNPRLDEGDPGGTKQIGWDDQFRISYLAANASKKEIIDALRHYAAKLKKFVPKKQSERATSWPDAFSQAADWLEDGTGVPYWSTFQRGNTKLPFWEWSVVAAGTCPGAGECLKFCYSIKFWFRVHVFMRQVMNTLLLRFHPDVVVSEFHELDFGDAQPYMRLHVHGDFQDYSAMKFWMKTIASRPEVKVYTYSKSWELFLRYDQENDGRWPKNFALNLSSGSIYGEDVKNRMLKLACTRGEFIALNLSSEEKKIIHSLAASMAKKNALLATVSLAREKLTTEQTYELGKIRMMALNEIIKQRGLRAGGERWFPCPGFCATCVGRKGEFHHACGMLDTGSGGSMQDVKIAIGVH